MDALTGISIATAVIDLVGVAAPIMINLAPKLHEGLVGFAERMIELSEKYPTLSEFATMLGKATEIVGDVLYAIGIIAEPSDVIGVKAEQADKGMGEFDSAESYISYLKNEIELDKEKYDNLSNEERAVYSTVGLAIGAEAIKEKIGTTITAESIELISKLAEIGKIVFSGKDIVDLLGGLKTEGIVNLNDVCECVLGKGDSDRLKTGEALAKVFDGIKPGEGESILNDIKDEIRKKDANER